MKTQTPNQKIKQTEEEHTLENTETKGEEEQGEGDK